MGVLSVFCAVLRPQTLALADLDKLARRGCLLPTFLKLREPIVAILALLGLRVLCGSLLMRLCVFPDSWGWLRELAS